MCSPALQPGPALPLNAIALPSCLMCSLALLCVQLTQLGVQSGAEPDPLESLFGPAGAPMLKKETDVSDVPHAMPYSPMQPRAALCILCAVLHCSWRLPATFWHRLVHGIEGSPASHILAPSLKWQGWG